MYRATRGSSFPCVNALITALGLATAEIVAANQETKVAEQSDQPSPSLDVAETVTGNVVFTILAFRHL